MRKLSAKLTAISAAVFVVLSGYWAVAKENDGPRGPGGPAPAQRLKKTAHGFVQEQRDARPPIKPVGERVKHRPSFKPLLPRDSREAQFAPDRIIVKFKGGLGANQTKASEAIAARLGLQKIRDLKLIKAQVLRITSGTPVAEAIRQLRASGLVEYAEPDYRVYASDLFPNDAHFPEQWGLHNTGQEIWGVPGTPDVDIDAPEAWQVSTGSAALVVAVIDTGVFTGHPDLAPNIWVNPGEVPGNGVDDDGNGYIDDVHGWDFYHGDNTVFDPDDGDEHGTHVAGTIAAVLNNVEGIAGIAQVKIMCLKFLGPSGGWTSDAILAIQYAADKGVKLSNNSYRGYDYSQALKDAIAASGMLFVAAAGNDASDNDIRPVYPASYDLDNILSVAAVDNQGYLAWFSNYGATSVDVAGPGVDVISTVPPEEVVGAAVESDTGTYRTVFWGFGLEDVDGAGNRADAMSRALNHLGVAQGAQVMLVDNDGSEGGDPNCTSFYTQALQSLGVPYTVCVVPAGGAGPSPQEMLEFAAVIWQTGRYEVLSYAAMNNLAAYLSAGGRLLLAGQDAIYSWDAVNWFAPNYLHVLWFDEGTSLTQVTGVPGTAYEGASYILGGTDSGWGPGKWRDLVEAADAFGYVDLEYPGTPASYAYLSGTSMATPHATGVAALVWSRWPGITDPVVVKRQIMGTVKRLEDLQGRTVTGGMVDAYYALTREINDDIPGEPYPGPDQTVTGSIHETDDPDDVYSVYLRAGERIYATLSGPADADFDLYLYAPTATTVKTGEGIVAASDQYGTSNEAMSYTAPVDGVYYLDVWAFAGSGSYTLYAFWGNGPGLYEESNEAIRYTGPWDTVYDPSFSGGQAKTADRMATATLNFTGAGVRWIAFKGPNQGIGEVFVDGDPPVRVDLYSPTMQYQQVVFERRDLTLAPHTITVRWTGRFSPGNKKTSTAVNLDAFFVMLDNVPPSPPTNLVATPNGNHDVLLTWNPNAESDLAGYNVYRGTASGGPYTKINSGLVTGNQFVDAGLPYGRYYYVVTAVDTSANESGYSNEATPYTVVGLGLVEDSNPAVLYQGSWLVANSPNFSGGTLHYSCSSGISAQLYFEAPNVKWIALKSPWYGIARVYIDGVEVATVDLYAPSVQYRQVVFTASGLGPGVHSIRIERTGLKNPSALGTYMCLDAFGVFATDTFEDNSPAISYTTTWSVSTNPSHSGGTLRYTNNSGAAAQLTFVGHAVKWKALKSPYYGIARVYIDGTLDAEVDLYSPTAQYQQVVYEKQSLTEGSHTIRIERTGNKNASALAAYISLDAFIVSRYTP